MQLVALKAAGSLAAAATPTFNPAPGTYTTAQTVHLADTTAGATIYYTTNGSHADDILNGVQRREPDSGHHDHHHHGDGCRRRFRQ